MATYVQKMRTIADNLIISLIPITDTELVSYILYGLDDDYESLITFVYAREVEILMMVLKGSTPSRELLAKSATNLGVLQTNVIKGHPAPIIKHAVNSLRLPVSKSSASVVCTLCQMGKSHKLPFQESTYVSTGPLDLVFTDVWKNLILLLIKVICSMFTLLSILQSISGFIL
ncbi:hypothetical protein LIER_09500 [Lithospermum erythrorhizon]|uniref:Uncharacterized protein n=1 Tax=Lithospermum erythrorhizon TaxID=34254 RepID=A0AAV3PH20_LITER